MDVDIRAVDVADNLGLDWNMVFDFAFPGGTYQFVVTEPYLLEVEDWKELARGERSASFYCGNGDGGIYCENSCLVFSAGPSGSGGDVTSRFTVGVDVVRELLLAAIADAVERGLKFHSEHLEMMYSR